jgi:glycosyltransferase involved in cell wall biosynthesis
MPWPTIGGVEVATLRLIQATGEEFRHIAFCVENAPVIATAFHESGIEVVSYRPPEPSARHGHRFYLESRAVADKLTACGAEMVACAEIKAAYHNSFAAALARVPLVSHVRSRYSTVSLRERLTYLPIKRYIFVSKDSRRQFGLKVPDRKARVLYDAVSFEESALGAQAVREELGVPDGAPLVGMAARVNPQKDYGTLAAAAAKVMAKRPDVRFLIVGDNAQVEMNRKHYEKVAESLHSLGIAQNFIFTGFRRDVSRLVGAMDLFVLCTHREGLPLVILEAMGMKKPVIATAVDGIPEVITHGLNGLLHEHENSDELAAAILRCVEEPEFAEALARAGREHVHSVYSAEAFSRNAANIYREMLSHRKDRE